MASADKPPLDVRESFAELLRFFRLRSGLSQADLAATAHLSARTISDLERGVRRRAYLPTVHALALALSLTTEERQRFSATVHRARARRLSSKRMPPGVSTELPEVSTSFIGRTRELAMLQSMFLEAERGLVTVTGPPGSGKSRLTIEAARAFSLHQRLPAWHLDLTDSNSSPQAIARLAAHLRQAAAGLLVIDNVERLASTLELRNLLPPSSHLRVLAAGRTLTNLPEEREFHIRPLATASAVRAAPQPGSPAACLLLDRVSPRPTLSASSASDVQAAEMLAERLDGLPLALEAAAAHVRSRSGSLGAFLDAPGDPVGDVISAAGQAIAASAAETYQLLSDRARWAFRQLAVLEGEWSLVDATDLFVGRWPSVQTSTSPRDVYNLIHSLVDHSLIEVDIRGPSVQFQVLALLRHYALHLLASEGESEDARAALRRRALDRAEDAASSFDEDE